MLVVLFRVVVFFTDLSMQDFTLLDSSGLFCCSQIATTSCNLVPDVICKEDIAASILIQCDMCFLCSVVFLLLDHCIWIGCGLVVA